MNSPNNNSGNMDSLYRGGLEELKQINDVGYDLSKLVERIKGLGDEPDKFVFRVRAQVTWFRSKHPGGFILPEIVTDSEFAALVKVTVHDGDGKLLQVAHASATADRDGALGFPLVETAESRAIARALDFAGYGCQLDIETFGDVSSAPMALVSTGAQPPRQAPEANPTTTPKPEPDKISAGMVSMKVPANGGQEPVDISALLNEEQSGPKPRGGRKPKKAEQSGEGSTEPVTDSSDAGAATHTANQEPAVSGSCEDTGALEDEAGAKPEQAPETLMEGLTAEQKVFNYIRGCSNGAAPSFDPAFFGDGEIDPDGFFVNNSGAPTRIRNRDLQNALSFFAINPEISEEVIYPAKETSAYFGKTFADILSLGREGEIAIFDCSSRYMRDNTPAFAAALFLAASLLKMSA